MSSSFQITDGKHFSVISELLSLLFGKHIKDFSYRAFCLSGERMDVFVSGNFVQSFAKMEQFCGFYCKKEV